LEHDQEAERLLKSLARLGAMVADGADVGEIEVEAERIKKGVRR